MRATRSLLTAALVMVTGSVWAGNGQGLFLQNCVLCHQATGMGLPGQFPRLAGRVSVISAQPKGREYLIDILTYGLAGTIKVDNQSIVGVMPPFSTLPNDVVADILSYVQTLGDKPAKEPKPFTETEVAAGRKVQKSMEKVQSERQALQADKVIE
jgi:mono/diheme cytochrome c family protein